MEPKDYAAWTGAVTGVLSLGWNFYSKSVEGPKLEVDAYAGMVEVPYGPDGVEKRFLRVTVRNVGTRKTTINNCGLHSNFKFSWRHRRRLGEKNAVMNAYRGPSLPHKLDAGEECQFLMEHDSRLDEWLGSTTVWFAAFHSHDPIHGTKGRILYPKAKKK